MNCRTAEKEDIGKALEYIRKPTAFENRPDEVKVDEGTEDFAFTLLYGSRREEEILFKEELAELL